MLESRDGCGPRGPTRATSVDHGGAAGAPLRGDFRAAVKIAFTVALAILVASCGGTAGSTQKPSAEAPESTVLHDHDDIALELGPPLPTIAPYVWPPGY